ADLGRVTGAHVEVVLHLQVRLADAVAKTAHALSGHDVAALDGHDLALGDGADGEEAAPVYRAPPYGGLGRAIGVGPAASLSRPPRRYSPPGSSPSQRRSRWAARA